MIDGDPDELAEHAARLTALGAEFAGTGAEVHARWQELGPVYQAPEAAELLVATVPVQRVTTAVGADLAVVGRSLATYAEELREIRARSEALRADAAALLDEIGVAEPDPGQAQRNDALVSASGVLLADFEDAQRRCASTINSVYGATGPGTGAEFVATAFGNPTVPLEPAPSGSIVDDLLEIGEDALNGAASFGSAALHNPSAALGLVGGTLLAGVSAVGVTAGGTVSATGVGAVAGVPLAGLSTTGLATGLGLAGVSGALLAQAAQGPDAVDLFPSSSGDRDRYGVWEGLAGDHPEPGDIAVSSGGRAHIPYGERSNDPHVDDGGGHWYESQVPGATVFPPDWTPHRILEAAEEVGRNPQRHLGTHTNGSHEVTGTVDDVEIFVRVYPDGSIEQAIPRSGPGVERNDENGDPQPLGGN